MDAGRYLNSISHVSIFGGLESDADCSAMSVELFDLSQLHDRRTYVFQAIAGELGAGDVLGERAKVDARILPGIAVSRCDGLAWPRRAFEQGKETSRRT